MKVKAVISKIHFKRMCRYKQVLVINIFYLWIGSDTYVVSLCTLLCIHILYFTSLKMTILMVETSRSLSIQNNFHILVCMCWHYCCVYPINALIMDHVKNS